jgi:hypothetical protein
MELPEFIWLWKRIVGCWVIRMELPDWLAIKEDSWMLSNSYETIRIYLAIKEDSRILSDSYGITRIYLAMKEKGQMLDSSYGITGLIGY